VPKGRLDETGRIPAAYRGLVETDSPDPAVRTRRNVRDADATLILTAPGVTSPGSDWTARAAVQLRKPLLILDLTDVTAEADAAHLRAWLGALRPRTLNVAGPRASEAPELYALALRLLLEALGASQPT
jgi:hypothetical protein